MTTTFDEVYKKLTKKGQLRRKIRRLERRVRRLQEENDQLWEEKFERLREEAS